ncbi:MAG: class I poly(R)-hydroxyalkanoic acid synthase [Geminicoccaceae bacterium]|nr:class I poly(R)-hydroxyalkanoic acid synthase [Geminicoccaceae bacterium]MCB9944832.1 class I poly(R)-hydroxyalkanoic acid synthase [Geminicoccaceae bacterium]
MLDERSRSVEEWTAADWGRAIGGATGALIGRDYSHELRIPDPAVVRSAMERLQRALVDDPELVFGAFARFSAGMAEVCGWFSRRMEGADEPPPISSPAGDRRFKDPAWDDDLRFAFIRQAYQLQVSWIRELVEGARDLDHATMRKVRFYAGLAIDAMAPTNQLWTNPAAIAEAVRTEGQSLRQGMANALRDIERGEGKLRITRTRSDAFQLGVNVAATRGSVVYENELMQLIQYAPATGEVMRRPLLIVPPWINKFYILDLGEKNSFIRWLVEQGMTVFVISWVNPGEAHRDKGFSDYLLEGPESAIDAIREITGEEKVNILGYCLGGTLTACFLARMRARGGSRVASATFLTTMLDFSDPGDLGVFIDGEQIELLDEAMKERGYLDAQYMQEVFNLLRANDLIWSFHVNGYLMGRQPPAFDLLYWNADGTRMPRMMHGFYLRKMYLENLLTKAGGIELAGEPIDLSRIDIPTYFLSTIEDHIAPWKSTYAGLRLLSGDKRFVLAGSGHIAGVINPETSGKYGYRTTAGLPSTAEAYLDQAEHNGGSWWPDWRTWISRHGGDPVPARSIVPGEGRSLEPAPGRYVSILA